MFLAHFWSIFPIFLSRTTSYGFLASCQNLEKTNETIPRKHPDRRKDGQTLFNRTLPANAGSPIKKCENKKLT